MLKTCSSHKTGSQFSGKHPMIDQSSQMFYVQVQPAVILINIQLSFYVVFLKGDSHSFCLSFLYVWQPINEVLACIYQGQNSAIFFHVHWKLRSQNFQGNVRFRRTKAKKNVPEKSVRISRACVDHTP